MAPPPDGIYRIRNISTRGWLALQKGNQIDPPVGQQVLIEKPKNDSDVQQWRLTNYDEYITIECFAYKGYYFVYKNDEADSPIISTKANTKIVCTDGVNGKLLSFSGGNTNLVMTADQHKNMGKFDTRNAYDMKQQWAFESN